MRSPRARRARNPVIVSICAAVDGRGAGGSNTATARLTVTAAPPAPTVTAPTPDRSITQREQFERSLGCGLAGDAVRARPERDAVLHLETAGAHPRTLARVLDRFDHVSLDLKPDFDLGAPSEFEPRDLNALAIVGSRRCSYYGREQAERFADLTGVVEWTTVPVL